MYGGGLGSFCLGMTICRQLARNLGVEILIQSEVGSGSEFTIRFAKELGSDIGPTASLPDSSRRVMVIDDEHGVRTSIAKLLEMKGHEVLQGDDRIDPTTVSDFKPHIVIIDMHMPTKTGTQVCHMVRQCGQSHVIATSSSDALCEEARADGSFDEAITKKALFDQISSTGLEDA